MNDPYVNMGLDEDALREIEEETPIENTEPGMEAFWVSNMIPSNDKHIGVGFFQVENELHKFQNECMCHHGGRPKDDPLLVRTSDGKNFRIYMKASCWFHQPYINKLSRFLDSRKQGETVTFVLGTKMNDYQSHILGSLISAMLSCQAEITTIVAGYCGICETIIWCFGKHRVVYRYGALTFGHTRVVKECPVYMNYFDVFYQQAVQIGALTSQEAEELKTKGSTMMLLSHEILQRLEQNNQQA